MAQHCQDEKHCCSPYRNIRRSSQRYRGESHLAGVSCTRRSRTMGLGQNGHHHTRHTKPTISTNNITKDEHKGLDWISSGCIVSFPSARSLSVFLSTHLEVVVAALFLHQHIWQPPTRPRIPFLLLWYPLDHYR